MNNSREEGENNNYSNYSLFVDKILSGPYEEIQVIVKLKKNIALVGRLIAYHQNLKSFDDFVNEEIRQTILAIGPDILSENQSLEEYAKRLLEGEEI
jgi:small nuclear ribonucleoprotein (snRNP)-like protein